MAEHGFPGHYTVLTAHPNLVPLYLAHQGARGPNAVRLGEVMDALLARAEVTGTAAAEALLAGIVQDAVAPGPRTDRP